MVEVFVESGVGGHIDDAVQAWTFGAEHRGRCGQGVNEPDAIGSLSRQLGVQPTDCVVRERIWGDEQAFVRDRKPATMAERDRTKEILRSVRPQTIGLLESCTVEQLDWDDADRVLPGWAHWRTLRSMGWHIVDTERRYYLARLGFDRPSPRDDLLEELRNSVSDTQQLIDELPSDRVTAVGGEVWTTTKVLRRLAWHERAELNAMEELAARAAAALGPG